MDWQQLQTTEDLEKVHHLSHERPVLIYKHSTRCNICTMALSRIERGWDSADYEKLAPFYLDVIVNRNISDAVAGRYGVMHQSPQVLVIRKGTCVYNESHSAISYNGIMSVLP